MKKLDTYVIKSDRNYYTLDGVTFAQAKASARENSYVNGYTGVYVRKQINELDSTMILLYGAENGRISRRKDVGQ